MRSDSFIRCVPRVALLLVGVTAVLARTGLAQTTTGSVRGYVTDSSGAPLGEAAIAARLIATGREVTATTARSGAYALLGLAPGQYQLIVRLIGRGAQSQRLELGVGEVLEVNFKLGEAAVQVAPVVISGTVAETKTSEVATNITPEQIRNLPTPDRNFLSLAGLVPGARVESGNINDSRKTFSAGAQSANNVNVFIDGASYKNDLTGGGVAGQDASRGNPFPRNAVQDFRVITENYKAEYQKASSAIISATTQSGTNTWTGNGFVYYQGKDLIALDSISLHNLQVNGPNFKKPDYSRYNVGISAGGPLVPGRLFIFGAYEGNYQNRAATVTFNDLDTLAMHYPLLDTVHLKNLKGNFLAPFRSSLGFGKLSYEPSPSQSYELSYNVRHETDVGSFGGTSSYQFASHQGDDVNSVILKHRRVGSKLLEEATFNFQSYRRHFGPLDSTLVARQYCNDTFPNCNNTFAIIGGSQSAQDYTQDRYSLRNDLTYSGLQAAGQHVIKVGANVDFLRYSTFKENNFNPLYQYFASDSFAFPRTASMGAGNPDFSANNTEIGAYVQDDWSPATRLTLNLGIRWDYESNMLDNDYVTPDSVKMSLDTVVPAKYFTDGTQRPAFLGAFQPRIGFSYALDAQGKTTLFGGFGVYYDRDLYDDVAIIEKYALQHPNYNFKFFANPADSVAGSVRWSNTYLTRQGLVGLLNSGKTGRPEVDLVANDTRQPKSNQWSLGVRRLIGDFVTSVTYTGVRSYNGFTYMCHNAYRDPLPSQPTGCFSVADTAHFGNIFISDDISRTWYNAVYVKVDKPYTPQGRWGAGIAYTLSWAKRDGGGQFDPAGGDVGLFSFDYRFPSDYPHYYAHFDQRHAIVGNWIWVVPGAVQFSGVVNLATATPFTIFTTPVQWNAGRLIASGLFPYRTVDIRLRRDFSNARRSMGVVLDVFNLFNYQNGGADAYGFPAVNYGSPQYLKSDARHVQIGTEVNF